MEYLSLVYYFLGRKPNFGKYIPFIPKVEFCIRHKNAT